MAKNSKNNIEGIPSYLSGDLDKLSEEKQLNETKLKSAQYAFAENVKRNIGPNIKREMNPTLWDRIKKSATKILNKITGKYGNN